MTADRRDKLIVALPDAPGEIVRVADAVGDGPLLVEFGEAAEHRQVRIRRHDGSEGWAALSEAILQVGGAPHRVTVLHDAAEDLESREQLRRLSLVANATDRALLLLDENRRAIYANPAFTELFGYTQAEIVGRVPTEVLEGPQTDQEALARLRRRAASGDSFHDEFLARDKWGRDILTLVSVSAVRAEDGSVRNIVLVMEDITKDKQIETLRREMLEALTSAASLRDVGDFLCRQVEALAPEVVCSFILVDAERRLRPLSAPSLPASFSDAINGAEIGPCCGSCGTAAYRGEPVQVTDIASDPLWAPFLDLGLPPGLKACWSSPIKARSGRVVGTFAFYYSENRGPSAWHEQIVATCLHLCMIAIEQHEANQQIAQLAHFDPLTGLPNRSRFHEDIEGQLREASEEGVAFFFLDVDRFNDVNETLGHSAGDQMLMEVARRLQRLFHGADAVYRFNGDEFLMVLPGCTAARAAAEARRALAALSEPFNLSGVTLAKSASIGISLCPENGGDGETLLQHAGAALSEAKKTQRGTIHFFSPEMDAALQQRLHLGNALREAIAGNALELHYQPQLAPESRALHGVEALARWTHPTLGRIAPDKFIPVAEETDQIEAIGTWSLGEACRQLALWRAMGIDIPTVSVNLSALHFRNSALPGFIAGVLDRYGLPPRCLTVEITESIMVDRGGRTLETVRAVRDLGVGLSMDDFGTGFSSLSNISRLPISELKIDRSFMQHFEQDGNAQALVRAVIGIGQSLGLDVVCEGVETEPQRRFLVELGCSVVQGYLFSRPLTPDGLVAWLAEQAGAAAGTPRR
ncbi:EAL domain-containing protein [Xanthobacter pseudotagetidis]|uniref:EAL domain-containing protein n=1 Tax=Xanthobacter pseudotagetidis TaxID=3119911 RepID=UPI00372B727A